MKEDFYHGGLFACMNGWKVKPHTASGDRYSDIYIEDADHEIGIFIEVKYAEKADFQESCSAALKQINDKNYEEALIDDGMTTIRKYRIACYKKRCRVISG